MTTLVYPNRLVVVGIGKESSFGTPVSAAAILPVSQPQVADNHQTIPDTGWRADPNSTYAHRLGVLSSQVQLAGPAFVDVLGWPLAGLLGDLSTSGAGAPYTHTIAAKNTGDYQPPSYTVTTDDPVGPLAFAGCRFTQFTLSANEGLLQWTAAALGLPGAAGSAPALTPPDVPPMPGWAGTVTLNGSVEARCLDLGLTIARPATPKRNTDGSTTHYAAHSGSIVVSGNATLLLASDTYRSLYLAGTALAVDASWAQGAGAASQQITFHSSSCAFDQVSRNFVGDWVELTVAWTADANTSDAGASGGRSPIKVTLVNAVPAGTYA